MLMQDSMTGVDIETATLVWLVEALEHVRSRGQTKIVGFLEEVADDMVFEAEAAAERSRYA